MSERRNSDRERRRRDEERDRQVQRRKPPRDRRSYEERSADRREEELRERRMSRRESDIDDRRRPRREADIDDRRRPRREPDFDDRRPSRRERQQQREEMRRKRKRKRIIILTAEIFILLILGVVAYGVMKLDLINYNVLDKNKLEVYRDTGPYTNIALFGLDSRDGEIDSGVRSDCMMVASINNETDEVKIFSLYRDTLLKQADGEFSKANSAYARGGAQEAIALMNRNFDLDIQNYISVNFNSLVDIIDTLGGIDIEISEEERVHMNNYAVETAKVVGQKKVDVEGIGLQHLSGVQAVSYSRIRYTAGGDYKRTERQRLVLQKVAEKAQKANPITLNKLMDKVLPQISTSFTKTQLLSMGANALSYKIGEMSGFPFEVAGKDKIEGDNASYVIPVGIAKNVAELHKFLFNEEGYVPSEIVQNISDEVSELSGIYPEQ